MSCQGMISVLSFITPPPPPPGLPKSCYAVTPGISVRERSPAKYLAVVESGS